MIGLDYSLQLCNVFYSDQVEPASCFQTLFGAVQTGLILKDVSLEVKSGEVLAVLGSKGSGKRALLEVISRRCSGPTRGQILLDGTPLTETLFQRTCAYVSHDASLIPTLSVEQTMNYAANLTVGPRVSPYIRQSRVRQVLADLALNQVSRWNVSRLKKTEYRRLGIGVQLVKDPAVLLLDEPTADLDPLTTYLIVSMLNNHAKRRSRTVILTMEMPRSDVFPFLDRVAYLCLGDVVYTGPTRLMMEYFKAIGFPCPQLENPLMYYLCLSTVDRRSRERFIESNSQIIALVEKFKMEGGPYRKSSATTTGGHFLLGSPEYNNTGSHKVCYSNFAKRGPFGIAFTLYRRLFAATFNLTGKSMCHLLMRLCLLPMFFAVLWFFYQNMQNYQWTFVSRSGLLFMCLIGTYIMSTLTTAYTFSMFRDCYYGESRAGVYSAPVFLLTYWFFSLPFSAITVALASSITFQVTGLKGLNDLYMFGTILWACYLLAEQQTIAIMMVVKSAFYSTLTSLYITCVSIILGSGVLRSYRSMADWLIYFSYMTQSRYAAAFLNRQLFGEGRFHNLPQDYGSYCTSTSFNSEQFGCRYLDGGAYLTERYIGRDIGDAFSDLLDLKFNMVVSFIFPIFLSIFNCLLYLLPLPEFVRSKF